MRKWFVALFALLMIICLKAPDTFAHFDALMFVEEPIEDDLLSAEYFFYDQLSKVEKDLYLKMSVATWENPEIIVDDAEKYSIDEMDSMAQRALAALMADDPEYHMYWLRSIYVSVNDETYSITLEKFPTVSEYHVQKVNARIQQIVETVGMEGDRYSRLQDLLNLLHDDTDYNHHNLLVRPSTVVQYDDSVYGCLLHNLAVCGGFSDTVKLLCDELEIPCIVVHTTGSFSHAWNFVQMEDGRWYSVDAAMDVENQPLLGSETDRYASDSGYHSSEYCLVSLYGVNEDFQFPELAAEAFVYDAEYAPSYHDVENSFIEQPGEFLYQINEDAGTCSIVGYAGLQCGDLVIPETIDGYTVDTIRNCAFARCAGFTGKLVIPESVKVIEEGAFYECIGLFGDLHLPSNLQVIQAYAFSDCSALTGSLILPDGLRELGFGAFINCTGFTGDLFIPAVDYLGSNVFDYCDGLSGTLYLADGLTWESSIVGDTNIQSVYVNPTNTQYAVYQGVLFSKDMKTLIWCPSGKTGGFTIPDCVETIGVNAFETCAKMTGTLVLPQGLRVIEEYAFFKAGFTGRLTIPDTVESIQRNAFCLTHFTGDLIIPDSVTFIGEGAFSQGTFDGVLYLPNTLTTIESYAFGGSPFAGDLIIPDTVKRIEGGAFMGCRFGGVLQLPDSLEFIGMGAFAGSSSTYDTLHFTNTIDLSNSAVIISEAAFEWAMFGDFYCNCDGGFFEEVRSTATCQQEGITLVLCNICAGTRWKIEEMLEHNMSEWVEVKAPTTMEPGLCERTCENCGTTEQMVLDKLDARGDVNGDGKINTRDARALLRYIAGLVKADEIDLAAADFNGDGKVNTRDARAILRHIAGLS